MADEDGVEVDLGLCLTGTKVVIPEKFVPVTETHSTLPDDYQQAASLTTHNNGVPSVEHFKPSDEVRVGESGLVIPKEVLHLREMVDLLADFNAQLRDLHRRSEQLQKKPLAQWRKAEKEEDAQIKKDAEEVVQCTEKLTTEMSELPDLLWEAFECWQQHEHIQEAIEACETKLQNLFDTTPGTLSKSLQALEKKEMDEFDRLAEQFDTSFQQLCAAVKKYNDVCG
eukprot:GGOE01000785.1.p2 GENE.GGOE01000785.1~~GGOE01000785.1.p2  ORF type:complete len:236 (+),score=96.21 GGOE01000785.1:32-709(+)